MKANVTTRIGEIEPIPSKVSLSKEALQPALQQRELNIPFVCLSVKHLFYCWEVSECVGKMVGEDPYCCSTFTLAPGPVPSTLPVQSKVCGSVLVPASLMPASDVKLAHLPILY